MPANTKISRETIIDAAFEIVRKGGWAQLSARSIAKRLKCSTMPIYSQFSSMADIDEEVVKKTVDLLEEYESKPLTGKLPIDHGIGYVLFAWKEPYLFAAINDRKHIGMQVKYGDRLFQKHVEERSRNPRLKGLSQEQLVNLEFQGWVFVHGFASMKNWLDETQRNVTEEDMVDFFRQAFRSQTYGIIQSQPVSSPERKEKTEKK